MTPAPKVIYLKTLHGTTLLPMGPPEQGILWVTVHPDDDKSRQFNIPISITGVEGGMAAINEFFGLNNGNGTHNAQLGQAPAQSAADSH